VKKILLAGAGLILATGMALAQNATGTTGSGAAAPGGAYGGGPTEHGQYGPLGSANNSSDPRTATPTRRSLQGNTGGTNLGTGGTGTGNGAAGAADAGSGGVR
jgi:hypothetical protein